MCLDPCFVDPLERDAAEALPARARDATDAPV